MKIKFNFASLPMHFPFGFSFAKFCHLFLKIYIMTMMGRYLFDPLRLHLVLVNDSITIVVWLVVAALVRFYFNNSAKTQTNDSVIYMNQMTIIKPEKHYNIFLHIFLIIICGVITFLNSFLLLSDLFALFFMGFTFTFSIIFTQLMFKIKWFSHHRLGLCLIFLFIVSFTVLESFFVFPFFSEFYQILRFDFIFSISYIIFIPLRDIIEKYLMDRHFVNIYNLLLYEHAILLLGTVIYGFAVIPQFFNSIYLPSDNVWIIILYIIMFTLFQFLRVKTIQIYNPNFKYLGDSVIFFLMVIMLYSVGLDTALQVMNVTLETVIPLIIGQTILLFFYLIGSFLFTELIIIYHCGLEENTKKEISNRGQTEVDFSMNNLLEIDDDSVVSV